MPVSDCQSGLSIAMRVGSVFRSFVLHGARPHDRSADFVCPDFHGARHLGRPSGCYQFPRTSFRSIVIVALCPATTAGLLPAWNHKPITAHACTCHAIISRHIMALHFICLYVITAFSLLPSFLMASCRWSYPKPYGKIKPADLYEIPAIYIYAHGGSRQQEANAVTLS